MTAKLDPFAAAPEAMTLWFRAARALAETLDPTLTELVKVRSSQINGCANCIHMHTREARARGETEQRLYLLSAWRDAPCYSERERAALAWTEALTRLSEGRPLEEARAALQAEFSEEDQVKLTLLINAINGWNRIAVGFGLFDASAGAKAAA